MDGLSELGNTSLGFQPQTALSLFFSLWLVLSVIGVMVYRQLRGKPVNGTSEFAVIAPKKKKRG
jgi:hypothetical protein